MSTGEMLSIIREVADDGGVYWNEDGDEGTCVFCGATLIDDLSAEEQPPFPHLDGCLTLRARAVDAR